MVEVKVVALADLEGESAPEVGPISGWLGSDSVEPLKSLGPGVGVCMSKAV